MNGEKKEEDPLGMNGEKKEGSTWNEWEDSISIKLLVLIPHSRIEKLGSFNS